MVKLSAADKAAGKTIGDPLQRTLAYNFGL